MPDMLMPLLATLEKLHVKPSIVLRKEFMGHGMVKDVANMV